MEDEDILSRVGTFFIVIASGFIVLFVVSDLANGVLFDLFFIGILLGGIGLYLRRKAPSPPPSGRFESYKKWRSGKLKDEMAEKRESQKAERTGRKEAQRAARKEGGGLFGKKKKDE